MYNRKKYGWYVERDTCRFHEAPDMSIFDNFHILEYDSTKYKCCEKWEKYCKKSGICDPWKDYAMVQLVSG